MPVAHELVGDLKHGSSLVRSFFYDDNVEDTISLARIRKGADGSGNSANRRRGKFSFVSMPDRTRRYDAITQGLLDGADGGGDAVDEHPLRTVTHFIGQGILHIFTGYDHVLFIVTLLLGVATWRQLALIVTAFTAAHSLTLALATLDIVSLPSQIVEPVIAASVLFVAVDAFVRPHARARVLVTFCFGLVHGFGLSSVLRDLGLSGGQLFPALLGFNLGVECGQLAIVAPLFPLILWLRKKPPVYLRTRNVLCASVALLAMCWIVIRVKEALVG
jgi:hydrogenase/urease accessory protein HupE